MYVDGVNGNDNNNCKSRQHACKTIGHAISLASSGDSATYTENLTININLKVIGSGAQTTIFDGGAVNTVVAISGGSSVTLSKLTVRNGSANRGGGIYNAGALKVAASIVTGNAARFGGGGIYYTGTLLINNSTVKQ